MPHSMIVWRSVKHDSRLYHSLGMYETHQIDNYLLVPALAISGLAQLDMFGKALP